MSIALTALAHDPVNTRWAYAVMRLAGYPRHYLNYWLSWASEIETPKPRKKRKEKKQTFAFRNNRQAVQALALYREGFDPAKVLEAYELVNQGPDLSDAEHLAKIRAILSAS